MREAVVNRSVARAGGETWRATSMAVRARSATPPAGPVRARAPHTRRHGDRRQESVAAMIGLLLIAAHQIDAAIAQQSLDVIGVECRDEEGGIELSLPQGRGGGSGVLLDQRGRRTSPG